MENADRRLLERDKKVIQKASKLEPRMQIGFISNPWRTPFGVNFLTFINNTFGVFIDIRSDFNIGAPGQWLGNERDKDWLNNRASATGKLREGGINILNAGIALSLFRTKKSVTSLYVGYGISSINLFEKYTTSVFIGGGPYYAKHSSVESENYNIGLLFQYNSVISWQIGYDSAVPGINVGIGFNFKNR